MAIYSVSHLRQFLPELFPGFLVEGPVRGCGPLRVALLGLLLGGGAVADIVLVHRLDAGQTHHLL